MESSAIYGLESQGRALCSSGPNELEVIRFYAGTLSPRSEGQIHQVDFDDETNKISRKIYKPKIGEIWQIQVCPAVKNLIGLCYNHITESSCQMKAGVFKITAEDENSEDPLEIKHILKDFEDKGNPQQSVVNLDWHPTKEDTLAIVFPDKFNILNIESNPKIASSWKNDSKIDLGKWNPQLEGNQIGLISDRTSVLGIDIRSMSVNWKIPKAHKFQVRDFDFNPNKQFYIATSGDDCSAKFWDFRKPSEPVKAIYDCHSHWIWKIRYNTFHDQLILTSGSDSRVILHSMPSISSEPKGREVLSEEGEEIEGEISRLEEGLLVKYEQHEDAVYAAEWSHTDPWIFASLSYDGRLIINRVPKSQKYKILL